MLVGMNVVKNKMKYPIVVDAKTREIRVGAWKSDKIYYNYPLQENSLHLKNKILEENGIKDSTARVTMEYGHREIHKEMIPLIGAKFYARLRAVSRKVWIEPVESILNKYCLYWNWANRHPFYYEGQIRRTWKVLNYIKQAEEDGLSNIIPIIIFFMDTPSALKRDLGKSVWKKIANNSLSFNMCIVRHLSHLEGRNSRVRVLRMNWTMFYEVREDLSFLLNLKKTLARNYSSYNFESDRSFDYEDPFSITPGQNVLRCNDSKKFILWINKYARVSNGSEINDMIQLYRDTRYMAKNHGLLFRECSPNKMKNFHDKLAKKSRLLRRQELLQYKQEANEGFLWLEPYSLAINKKCSYLKNINVELIDDYERLLDEGDAMEHCVADYESFISEESYIVISLEGKDNRSTLGLCLDGDKFIIEQHYGYDNDDVYCSKLNSTAKKIVSMVNQVYWAIQKERVA